MLEGVDGLDAGFDGLDADEVELGVADWLVDSAGLMVADAGGLSVGLAKATPTAGDMASPVASAVAPASRPVMDVRMMTPKV